MARVKRFYRGDKVRVTMPLFGKVSDVTTRTVYEEHPTDPGYRRTVVKDFYYVEVPDVGTTLMVPVEAIEHG